MRHLRSIALPALLVAVLAASVALATYGGTPSFAATASTTLHKVLAQLHRNSKVSERLNAGFFRAPQTRGFVGSAFQPTDSATQYNADRGDSALSLKSERPTTATEQHGGQTVVKTEPQTNGTFELPLDIPNRAQVVKVQASYKDASGGNTTTNGTQAPSGFDFSVVKYDFLGGGAQQLLAQPAGVRSTDGKTGTDILPIAGGNFRVDNSRNRYVLRVRIDDVQQDTRFYGLTIQYVIGKGVAGAPSSK